MSLAECQINLIDVHFHFQKRLEIFDKNPTDKYVIQKGQGDKLRLMDFSPIVTYLVLTQ